MISMSRFFIYVKWWLVVIYCDQVTFAALFCYYGCDQVGEKIGSERWIIFAEVVWFNLYFKCGVIWWKLLWYLCLMVCQRIAYVYNTLFKHIIILFLLSNLNYRLLECTFNAWLLSYRILSPHSYIIRAIRELDLFDFLIAAVHAMTIWRMDECG
jgi:hypothetical protein